MVTMCTRQIGRASADAFLVVEYDAYRGNPWVPYPFSQVSWVGLADAVGLDRGPPDRAGAEPLPGAIYSAVAGARESADPLLRLGWPSLRTSASASRS